MEGVPQLLPTESGLSCRCRIAARSTAAVQALPVHITQPMRPSLHFLCFFFFFFKTTVPFSVCVCFCCCCFCWRRGETLQIHIPILSSAPLLYIARDACCSSSQLAAHLQQPVTRAMMQKSKDQFTNSGYQPAHHASIERQCSTACLLKLMRMPAET